jgi:hypothetical protein
VALVRNFLKNLNVSFESSNFENVLCFEINALSTTIHFKNCSFSLNDSNQRSNPYYLAKNFIYILHSNITLENSICKGLYENSNEDYIFFVAEKSQAFIYNFEVYNMKIGEVRVDYLIVLKNKPVKINKFVKDFPNERSQSASRLEFISEQNFENGRKL